MGTYKQDRAAEDIKRELAAIIRELKDPRLSEHLISISRAEVTGDLSYVKAYVSAIEGIDVAKQAVKDAKKGRDMSVCSLYVKCQHVNVKLLPQRLVMQIWMAGIRKYLKE